MLRGIGGVRLNFDDCRRGFFYGTSLPSYCDEYFKYFQPGPVTEDKDKLFRSHEEDNVPPEETEEYKRALWIYEDHLRRSDEALRVSDLLYWHRRMENMIELWENWSPWAKAKLFLVGRELTACLFAGAALLTVYGIFLSYFGPIRIKTAGIFLMIFICGSTLAKSSIEIAACCVIGLALIGFIFVTKISTGHIVEVKRESKERSESNEKDAGEKYLKRDYSVVIRIHYWYIGKHNLWINITEGMLGID